MWNESVKSIEDIQVDINIQINAINDEGNTYLNLIWLTALNK